MENEAAGTKGTVCHACGRNIASSVPVAHSHGALDLGPRATTSWQGCAGYRRHSSRAGLSPDSDPPASPKPSRKSPRRPTTTPRLYDRYRREARILVRPIGRWRLRPDAEETLRALGECGDIVRALRRAFITQQRELAIFNPTTATATVVGRAAAKGLADELNDRAYFIIDGVDGRAHYVALPAGADLGEIPIGGIVEARSVTARAADGSPVLFDNAVIGNQSSRVGNALPTNLGFRVGNGVPAFC